MSKRKGRRQPLTSEIKSVLRAPDADGERESPTEGNTSDAPLGSSEAPTDADVAARNSDADAASDTPASSELLDEYDTALDEAAQALDRPELLAEEPDALSAIADFDDEAAAPADSVRASAADSFAADSSAAGSAAAASAPPDSVPAPAPSRRGRRSRASSHVEVRSNLEEPSSAAEPSAAADDSASSALGATDGDEAMGSGAPLRAAESEDNDGAEDEDYASIGERFAEQINFDDTGDDTEGFLRGLVEALLFTSQKPIDIRDLARSAGIDKPRARELIEQLRKSYEGRGLCIEEVAGGFVMRSSPRYAPYIHKILALKPVRLSRAQLETLAIVAYRQPVTKPEVDDIRGVDSGQVIKGLLERSLLKMLGKKDEPGHPTLYGTTNEFLELLNLQSLKDLPTLREYTELSEESQRKFTEATGEAAPSDTLGFERSAAPAGDASDEVASGATPPEGSEAPSRSEADGAAVDSEEQDATQRQPSDSGERDSYDDAPRSRSDVVAIDEAELGEPEDLGTRADGANADADLGATEHDLDEVEAELEASALAGASASDDPGEDELSEPGEDDPR